MKRSTVVRLLAMFALLLAPAKAGAQSDRAAALAAVLSHVMHRDSASCSGRGCESIGLLVSAEDSANLDSVRSIGLIPVTATSVERFSMVHRVYAVTELNVTGESCLIHIEHLVDNTIPTPWMPAIAPPAKRFHRAGFSWDISCVRSGRGWSVTRVVESIV